MMILPMKKLHTLVDKKISNHRANTKELILHPMVAFVSALYAGIVPRSTCLQVQDVYVFLYAQNPITQSMSHAVSQLASLRKSWKSNFTQ